VSKIENSKLDPKFDEVAHLMSGIRGRKVYETGDINAGVWTVGQATGLIKDIPTCVELAKRIECEATEALSRANARFSSDSHL
jgi:NAD(P)H-dependent flavin oxidoreductase YrpB (nitropropane dioxygenase family)